MVNEDGFGYVWMFFDFVDSFVIVYDSKKQYIVTIYNVIILYFNASVNCDAIITMIKQSRYGWQLAREYELVKDGCRHTFACLISKVKDGC